MNQNYFLSANPASFEKFKPDSVNDSFFGQRFKYGGYTWIALSCCACKNGRAGVISLLSPCSISTQWKKSVLKYDYSRPVPYSVSDIPEFLDNYFAGNSNNSHNFIKDINIFEYVYSKNKFFILSTYDYRRLSVKNIINFKGPYWTREGDVVIENDTVLENKYCTQTTINYIYPACIINPDVISSGLCSQDTAEARATLLEEERERLAYAINRYYRKIASNEADYKSTIVENLVSVLYWQLKDTKEFEGEKY